MKNIIFILFIIILSACEKINLKEADYDMPVIEAYLFPGKKVELIITRQLVFESNDSVEASLGGLEVKISDGEQWYIMENNGDSLYSNPNLKIVEDSTYFLEFEYNNLKVTASTTVPCKPIGTTISNTVFETFSMEDFSPWERPEFPDPETISWVNPEEDYYMLITESIEDTLIQVNSSNIGPARLYRSEPVQTETIEVNPRDFQYYGRHYLILCHLNREYAGLYEQIQATSLDIKSPPSNIENGLGIFTAVNTDTIIVNVISQ